jgi:MinD superfamily P-loop ATPase
MKRAIEVVHKFNIPSFVIINKYDLNKSMSRKTEEWCIGNNVNVAGMLPFDRQITEAMIEAKSIIEFNPESEISKKLITIWNRIVNQ